jgi:protein-tyrosine phosphatase
MRGLVDLHCHWVPSIDDGVKSKEDGVALLQGLKRLGFDHVVATPHMRPGMFENDAPALRAAYAAMAPALEGQPDLPLVSLSSEHFLDDVVFERIRRGEGLPYLGGGALLVELTPEAFPRYLSHRFFDLRRAGYQVVLAHPERYQPVWKDDACLDALLDAGAHLLLDVCAIVGKYGRASQKAAEKLLEDDAYEAACSDAHRPSDVQVVGEAMRRLESLVGEAETYRLLGDGPRSLLAQAPLATRATS